MKIVRFSKKILCAVLISCMLVASPLCAYLDTQGVQEVNASSVVGTTALLELLLAGFGVTVAGTALNGIVNTFDDWLRTNGSSESVDAWDSASLSSYVAVIPSLVADVGAWLLTKFDSLTSGSVSHCDDSAVFSTGALTGYQTMVYNKFAMDVLSYPYYYIQASDHGDYPGVFFYGTTNTPYFIVVSNYGPYLYRYDSSTDKLNPTYFDYSGGTCSMKRFIYPDSLSYSGWKNYAIDVREMSFSSFVQTNFPTIITSLDINLGGTLYLSDLLPYATKTVNLNVVSDAFTSYGGYSSSNTADLSGLIVTPAIISAIMSAVNGAVASNKTEDEQGNIVWSDAVAQAVSDAYAAGLADAKAQQGELKDDVKEEERTTAITGWLSKIYDGILAIPSLVVNAWQGSWLNDIFDGIVEFMQSILTGILSIPSAIVDAWEGSWLQDRLEHTVIFLEDILDGILSIPSAVVDAWENSWLKERLDRTVLFLEDISSNVRDIAQSLTQEASPDDFTVSLSSLFPFCIPFDLYDMLSVLCAEPQAPRFEWQFPNGSGEMESLTIDLSKFDTVAQIVRAMEIIFFSVGLALKTRDLIRG